MVSSREFELESVLAFVRQMGREHGRGPIGRFVLATFLCARAQDDDQLLEPDDAPAVMQAMKEGSGNDNPDISKDLRAFIVLGRRTDIDGVRALQTALARLIVLKNKRTIAHARSWACLCAFAHAQSETKQVMSASAVDMLFKRTEG